MVENARHRSFRPKIDADHVAGRDAGRGNLEEPHFPAGESKPKSPPKKRLLKRLAPSVVANTIFRDICLGDAPAGNPCPGEFRPENWEESVRVNVTEFPQAAFALRVRGDSMTGRKIKNGEILIFALPDKREPVAGDVVAACIDGEVTIKTLVKTNGKSTLKSENPAYPAPHVTKNSAIQGVMLGKWTGKEAEVKLRTPHVASHPSKDRAVPRKANP